MQGHREKDQGKQELAEDIRLEVISRVTYEAYPVSVIVQVLDGSWIQEPQG